MNTSTVEVAKLQRLLIGANAEAEELTTLLTEAEVETSRALAKLEHSEALISQLEARIARTEAGRAEEERVSEGLKADAKKATNDIAALELALQDAQEEVCL